MKNSTSEPTAEERELIETLIKYPALEAVFDSSSGNGFAEIKQKMQATLANLERVVRRGEKSEAERASVVITAYQTAINFIGELEQIAKNQSK
jgi:hypothetical protein